MDRATALDRRLRQSGYSLRLASAGASTKDPILPRRSGEGCADSSGRSINAAQAAAQAWTTLDNAWSAQRQGDSKCPTASVGTNAAQYHGISPVLSEFVSRPSPRA